MVFGWGKAPDPDPQRAKRARDALERALSFDDDHDKQERLEALSQAAEEGARSNTPDGFLTSANALIQKARLLEVDAPDEAQAAYQDAHEAATRADTTEGVLLAAQATLHLGRLHEAHDQLQAAAEAYQGSLDAARDEKHLQAREWAAHAALHLARARANANEPSEGIDPAREAIELGQAASTPHGAHIAATASLETGRLLRDQARFAEATDALERARRIANALPEPHATHIKTLSYEHEGRLHQDEGRRAAAKDAYQEAIDAANRRSTPRTHQSAARAAWMLALVHAERGSTERVNAAFNTAQHHAQQSPPPQSHEHAAKIHLSHAHQLLLRGDETDAATTFTQAAEQATKADTPTGRDLAQTARARNVALAGGNDPINEDPPRARPGTPPLPPLPDAPDALEPPPQEGPRDHDEESHHQGDPDTMPDPTPNEETIPQPPTSTNKRAPIPSPRPNALGDLVDQAETLRQLALASKDQERLQEAIQALEQALEQDPRDPDLLHRIASFQATLAAWRDDADELEDALNTFQRAYQEHGGRVDPATHRPGPSFFFDWGTAAYELARRTDDETRYDEALQHLDTGYQMTPRGARHQIAAARMARCEHGIARTRQHRSSYESVTERYEALDKDAPYALDPEDYAIWAKALSWLGRHEEAFEKMNEAYERSN